MRDWVEGWVLVRNATDRLELGVLEARRISRFKVYWPDGGAGPVGEDDNRFQASATDVRFIWHLTER